MVVSEGDRLSAAEKLTVPVIVLGAIWGAFDVVLGSFVILNERRDFYLSLKADPDHARQIGHSADIVFWSDWLPMWSSTGLFLVVITAVLASLPRFIAPSEGAARVAVRAVSRWAMWLGAFGVCAWAAGGAIDIVALFK